MVLRTARLIIRSIYLHSGFSRTGEFIYFILFYFLGDPPVSSFLCPRLDENSLILDRWGCSDRFWTTSRPKIIPSMLLTHHLYMLTSAPFLLVHLVHCLHFTGLV